MTCYAIIGGTGLTQLEGLSIKQMHKLLYREGRTLESAREAIAALAQSAPEAAGEVALMSGFLAAATRGIAR